MLEKLSIGLNTFKIGLQSDEDILLLQKNWALTIDEIVTELFNNTTLNDRTKMAIMALGGYGRFEMSPYSDVDLLFLYDGNESDVRDVVNGILYPLWDSKFEAGGATRTLIDCRKMFNGDLKAKTAMLDAHFVCGDKNLSERFFDLLNDVQKNPTWKKKFIKGKYEEYDLRIRKFSSSIYLLEPNMKEGKGGLRDWNTAVWMSRINNGGANFKGCEDEIKFIFRLRDYLHLNYNKREDRLTFENQLLLAKQLQIEPSDLMQRLYTASSTIHIKTRELISKNAPFLKRLKNKWKESRINRLLGEEPSWQRLAANRDILYDALISFHESNKLSEIIPSIEKIRFRTQYGAYHVYTVDMHSILTVKKIVELEVTKRPRLVYNAYKNVKKKDLLLLTALLHDIGKGDPDGTTHTHKGAEEARNEALRCGYSEDDAQKIAFLIESHLIMPKIAFSRDIGDTHLIDNFATSIGSEEILNMLYVLTYADIASIGPDVWNEWKERLLGQLYTSTLKWLKGIGPLHLKAEIEKLKSEVKKTYNSDHVEHWLNIMPDRYFGNYNAVGITSHIQMFEEYNVAKPSVLVKHDQFDTHSELLIMTKDAPGLFSKIAGLIASHRINILDAELHTAKDGLVFDILRVQSEIGKPLSQNIAFDVIYNLESVLSGKKDVNELLISRHQIFKREAVEVENKVVIDNDVSAYYTVIDVQARDRLGLLYNLSHAFFDEACSIWLAKILTKAETAIDTFYITDLAGNKILNKGKLEGIKEKILAVLA